MLYLRLAVFLFNCLAFLTLVGGFLLVRADRYSCRLVYPFLAGVCAVAALLNALVDQPWIALPWGLCVPLWVAAALRFS